ncbi:MAG: hypothetical protein ABUK01_13695 [Leptospirales bacterium]
MAITRKVFRKIFFKTLLRISVLLPVFIAPVLQTTAGDWDPEISFENGFSDRKVIGLALNAETIKVYNSKSNSGVSAVLFVNSSSDQSYARKLASGLELPGKVFIFPLFSTQPHRKNDYQISRVKSYLRDNRLTARFPSFHPQYHMVNEILQENDADTAIFSGLSCLLPFIEKTYGKTFQKYVMLSPPAELDEFMENPDNAKFLWVGSGSEKYKLQKFQKKYGGEILIFENSGSGYMIFFRNHSAQAALKEWLSNGV